MRLIDKNKVVAKFNAKVIRRDGCWGWNGSLSKTGYARIHLSKNNKTFSVLAHRVSYEMSVGPIAEGLTIDHLCRNRSCTNPDHLEVVSQGENTRRGMSPAMILATRECCNHGHEFTPENTKWKKDGEKRYRSCLACDRERQRKFYHRNKERILSKNREFWHEQRKFLINPLRRKSNESDRFRAATEGTK